MKLKLNKKSVIELGAFIIIGLIAVFMASGNTNFFKGDVTGDQTNTCETQQSTYQTLHNSVKNSLDEVEMLNIKNFDLQGYQARETEIETINTFLTENATYSCESDMTAVETQLNTYKNTDIPGMQSEIEALLGTVPLCPLDDEQHSDDYQLYADYVEAHQRIESGITALNGKRVWGESDYENLKKYVLSMRVLDISDLSGNVTEEELAQIEANLADIDVDFANNAIRAYNTDVVGAVQDLDCDEVEVIALLNAPTECETGTVYSESSQACVAVANNQEASPQCEYRDLYEDMDLIYEILELYEDDPENFGEEEEEALVTLLGDFPAEYASDFENYTSNFNYEQDANTLIEDLNFTIVLTENETCSKNMFSDLDIEGNDDDEQEYSCPVGATHSVVNDIDICTCDNDASLVESDGTCEDDDEEENNNDEISLFLCLDGVTEVEDPLDCPSYDDGVVDETEEPQTPAENTESEYYSSAETLEVNQGNNLDLTTNTNPNIMTSPEVQGDTGPGALTAFLMFLSVLGGGLLRTLSII